MFVAKQTHLFERSSPINTLLDLLKLLRRSQMAGVPDPFSGRRGLATRD